MNHEHHAHSSLSMAVSATLHCLTGCAIGEIAGMIIGTAAGLDSLTTILLSIGLAFFFGYILSTFPLLWSGMSVGSALRLVLAADSVSITTMELMDNVVMAAIPGAMNAGLVNPIFWIGMPISLVAAFAAALPVNRWLLARGKGHALVHGNHSNDTVTGWRQFVPLLSTPVLLTGITMFIAGGLLVAIAKTAM